MTTLGHQLKSHIQKPLPYLAATFGPAAMGDMTQRDWRDSRFSAGRANSNEATSAVNPIFL